MNCKYKISFLLIVFLNGYQITARDSQLQFIDVPLNEVITELSTYYSINFIYNDELIKDKKVACNLATLDIDSAIHKLLSMYNLSFKKVNENTYVLYKNPVFINNQNKKNNIQIELKKQPSFTAPKAMETAKIPYPDVAKEKGFEGEVDMQILINKDGKVETVRVQKSSNYEILDQTALEYAKKIKFHPAQIDSQSVSIWSKWKVIFKLVPYDTTYSEVIYKDVLQ